MRIGDRVCHPDYPDITGVVVDRYAMPYTTGQPHTDMLEVRWDGDDEDEIDEVLEHQVRLMEMSR